MCILGAVYSSGGEGFILIDTALETTTVINGLRGS